MQTSKPLSYDHLLAELLKLHENEKTPEKAFIDTNVDGFEKLWVQGLGCYMITRMVAGNIKARRMFEGVLTPKGLLAARHK